MRMNKQNKHFNQYDLNVNNHMKKFPDNHVQDIIEIRLY